MFHPSPRIQEQVFPGGRCWVVDGALLEPDALVQRAAAGRARFAPAPFNAYPGLEWHMGPDVAAPLADFFLLHLRQRLGARRTLGHYSRLSLATLQPHALGPLQRLCHRDRFGVPSGQCAIACTLYLFKDPALGGTSFYSPRQPIEETDSLMRRWHAMDRDTLTHELGTAPGYITDGNRYFERVGVVPAAFNRAVFYDGSQFHSSHITEPQRLTDDPTRGRLTLNGFFICRRLAA